MIHRISMHRGPGAPLRYAMDPEKAPRTGPEAGTPEIVATNMTGRSASALDAEFNVFLTAKPFADARVAHIVISPHTEDLQKIPADGAALVIEPYLARQGYAACPYVAIAHHDTGTLHWSVIVACVDASGHLVASNWEGRIGRVALLEMEERHGLARTGHAAERRAPNADEMARDARLSEEGSATLSVRDAIRARVDAACEAGITMSAFAQRLRAQDVRLRLRMDAGEIRGISYACNSGEEVHARSGTQLGRVYTWRGLQLHRGLEYAPERDTPQLLLDPPPLHEVPTAPIRTLPEPLPIPPPGPAAGSLAPVPEERSEPAAEATPEPERLPEPIQIPSPLEEMLAMLERGRHLLAEQRRLEEQRRRLPRLDSPAESLPFKLQAEHAEALWVLQSLYADPRGALAELEARFDREHARGSAAPDCAAAVIRALEHEPEGFGPLLDKRRLFGKRPLTLADAETQEKLPRIVGEVGRLLGARAERMAERARIAEMGASLDAQIQEVLGQRRALGPEGQIAKKAAAALDQLSSAERWRLEERYPLATRHLHTGLGTGGLDMSRGR